MLKRARARGRARPSIIETFHDPLGFVSHRKRRPHKRPYAPSRAQLHALLEIIARAMEPIAISEDLVVFTAALPTPFIDTLAAFDAEFEDYEDGGDRENIDEREECEEDGDGGDFELDQSV